MNIALQKQKLYEAFGKRCEENTDLFSSLTLRLHTKAEFFFKATSRDDLIKARKVATDLSIPFHLIGGGSNIVIQNEVLSGLTVKNEYRRKSVDSQGSDVLLTVSSGYLFPQLVSETVSEGIGGFEYHQGLPGTVGGAIYMNSKWTRPLSYVGDSVERAVVCDEHGVEKTVDKEYFTFSYDYSNLQKNHDVLLEVVFRLKKEDKSVLIQRSQEALLYRKKTQPMGKATCGCFFQNISEDEVERLSLPTGSAGFLIDKSKLKGARKGSFVVSSLHANFIINEGEGSVSDLLELVTLVKKTVKDHYNVELKEEVQLWK